MTRRHVALALALACLAGVIYLQGCGGEGGYTPKWRLEYSNGVQQPQPYGPTGCVVTFDERWTAHYLTHAGMKGTQLLSAVIQVSAPIGTKFDFPRAGNSGTRPAGFGLFFQRSGDNLTGSGKYAHYRWWNRNRVALAEGVIQVNGNLLDPSEWTNVWGQSGADHPAEFADAVREMGVSGFTFGGGSFYGHGVTAGPGAATFTVVEFRSH